MPKRWALAMTAYLLFAACGPDPRLEFIGSWRGPLSLILKYQDGSSESLAGGELNLVVTAPEQSDRLQFNGSCRLTARVTSADRFVIDEKPCPTERVEVGTASRPLQCDVVEVVRGGAGTRRGEVLTVSAFGETQFVRCSDGGPAVRVTYTQEAVLRRQ